MCGVYTGEYDTNGFYKLKLALEQKGWYVGWAIGFFQDEAWCNVPYEFPKDHPHAGKKVDLDKCLFNIIQDVEKEDDFILELDHKLKIGVITEEEHEEQSEAFYDEYHEEQYFLPEEVNDSCFCFGKVKTLKEILPIIEECDCWYAWNGSIKERITIGWDK
jgi:hypothetical protein